MHARCSQCGALSTGSPPEEALDLAAPSGTRHCTLLNSSEPPDHSDLPLIHSVISKTDARLACLDDEIAKLRETLEQLEKDRMSLWNYRTRNTAILSPLRRMPTELLGEIFLRSLPSLHDQWKRNRLDIANSPWVLTRISRRWRAVSLSIPSLWSRVAISYSEDHDPSSAYPFSLVEAQIQRSQTPLKIHFYGCETVDSFPQIRTFKLLSQHSARWEELSVGMTSEMVPMLAALRGRLHSLKRSWLNWIGPESQTGVQTMDSFETAPSLVEFGVFHEFRFIPTSFPIHQLTRYQLDGPWETHREILKLALNLVEARIEIEFQPDPWPDYSHETSIDLLHLRRLALTHLEFLNHLRVPTLEELALELKPDNSPDIIPLLRSFLDRSSCHPRRISLSGGLTAHTTIDVLHNFSSITELAIVADQPNVNHEVNMLLSNLTVWESKPITVAPQLRSIFFGCADENHIDYSAYLAMVESRWKAENCALKRAALLSLSSGPDPATLADLTALCREGLDILLLEGTEAADQMNSWFYTTTWN